MVHPYNNKNEKCVEYLLTYKNLPGLLLSENVNKQTFEKDIWIKLFKKKKERKRYLDGITSREEGKQSGDFWWTGGMSKVQFLDLGNVHEYSLHNLSIKVGFLNLGPRYFLVMGIVGPSWALEDVEQHPWPPRMVDPNSTSSLTQWWQPNMSPDIAKCLWGTNRPQLRTTASKCTCVFHALS